jgi:eukaryotic-like serine/threonine-protein kinase
MSTPSITAGQLLGHYRLIERIGGGGQGDVWRAHDERFDRDVALKILSQRVLASESARERFRQEARAVGRLNHPNIATAHDFGDQPVDYLVTEFVEGTGLDDKLAGGPLPEATIAELGIQLASGLEAAHRQGIIHRDLKPGNLRISTHGSLKILDFGLAELIDPKADIASAETVTITMTLTGTLPYMAPEQFDGISDQRTDLWAAGVVLYEMATGQLPFPMKQLAQLKDAILHQEPARPKALNPLISPALENVILRCLQKNPAKRYQTATDLREDLARAAEGRPVSSSDGLLHGRGFAVALLTIALAGSAVVVYRFWPQINALLGRPSGASAEQFRVLAILPVQSTSESSSDNALVRGMAETVSARIAQGTNGKTLQLIPPSELIARDARTTDAVRREFGVDGVLEVAVQRSGEKVRVTCSLIDPKTHHVLKACTVTGDGSDLFALQDTLAGEVIAMLPRGTRNEQAEPTEVQAAAPAGYEFYLKGRGYLLEYQKAGNIDAAIKEFGEALKLSPNYAPAYSGLGEAYWQGYKADRGTDWLDKAQVNCNKALTLGPKLAEGHTCIGNVDRSRGQYDEALREIQQAIALDPNNALSLLALGDTYDKLDKYPEAETEFKRAIALSPNYWAVYNWAGFFYYRRAKYSEAEAMFRKAANLAPGNQRAFDNLGAMYLMEGRYQDAIDSEQHSINLQPTTMAYSNLGASYFYLRRYPEAIAAFEKARALDDQDYLNWGNLGDALYWSASRRSEATSAYKRAIELAQGRIQVNPKDATARVYVAEYSAMLGDRPTAMRELQRAQELAPTDPDIMFRAALVYNQFGDRTQTLDWLGKTVAAGYSRSTVRDTPDFVSLQADPKFKSIIAGS